MGLKVNFDIPKKLLISVAIVLIFAAGAFFLISRLSNKNPLPTSIKSGISYKVIYPSKTAQIDISSYQYQPSDKTLTFKVNASGKAIIFTEQPAPATLGSGSQVYYPALGIHPYAQFQTDLGPVALTKFYQSGTLELAGQAAVLASGGTLLFANSKQSLSNDEWKNLFDSLKISK